jgi:hypothetical protein
LTVFSITGTGLGGAVADTAIGYASAGFTIV